MTENKEDNDKMEMKERKLSDDGEAYDPRKSNPAPIPGDPIEESIGSIGRWQAWTCLAIVLVKFGVAWHQMGIIFLAPPSEVKCADPGPEVDACSSNCTSREYDRETFGNTIVMEWDLTCSRAWMKDLTQTAVMFGILVGNMVFGFFADRYGRRWPLIVSVVLQAASGVLAAFCPDWYSFTATRFIVAVATGGTMVTSFVLIMEIIGVKYREVAGILFQIPFNLGHLTLVGIAYLTHQSWSSLQFWVSIPSVLLFVYYWVLPESPRWLLAVGRHEKAAEILIKGAKANKMPTDNIMKKLKDSSDMLGDNMEPKENMLSLFKKPNLRMKTIYMCFDWLACGLCFFGVSQYIGQIGGNIYVNVALSAAIQVPGTLSSIAFNRLFGRKKTLFYSYVLSGSTLIAIAIIPQTASTAKIVLASVGILGMSISFPTVYVFAGEIFPTVLRNTGIGLCSMIARVGSMLAPFVAGLGSYQPWLPPAIFGGLPIIAAFLTMLLPETHGKALPDTLREAEYAGRRRKSSVISTFETPRM